MKFLHGLIAAVVLMGSTAMAQYPRDYRGDNRGYGYERRDGGFNVIRVVQADLERVASRGRMSGRERNRIDQALRKLNDFERDVNRGRFDRHDLDKAIQKVDEVVRSREIDPRERNVLIGDLNRLREFRFDERAYRR